MKVLDLIVTQQQYTLRDLFTFAANSNICEMALTTGVVDWTLEGFVDSTREYLNQDKILIPMQTFIKGVIEAFSKATWENEKVCV